MPDQEEARRRAAEGWKLWQAKRLEEAAGQFEEALQLSDPDDHETASVHGQCAIVLVELGRDQDALVHFERALEVELSHSTSQDGPAVEVARYFLAEHLLRLGRPEDARRTIGSSLRADSAILQLIEAESLWDLGRHDDARLAAQRAVDAARNADQLKRIQKRLETIGVGRPTSQ